MRDNLTFMFTEEVLPTGFQNRDFFRESRAYESSKCFIHHRSSSNKASIGINQTTYIVWIWFSHIQGKPDKSQWDQMEFTVSWKEATDAVPSSFAERSLSKLMSDAIGWTSWVGYCTNSETTCRRFLLDIFEPLLKVTSLGVVRKMKGEVFSWCGKRRMFSDYRQRNRGWRVIRCGVDLEFDRTSGLRPLWSCAPQR